MFLLLVRRESIYASIWVTCLNSLVYRCIDSLHAYGNLHTDIQLRLDSELGIDM